MLYQTQANARARQKERGFISLEKYCGLQLLNRIDSNHYNVIVVITTTDVVPLSFESIDQRVGWLGQLQKHFGQGRIPTSVLLPLFANSTALVRILAGSLRILKDPQGSCRNPARTGSFQDPFRNLQGSYKDPARQGSL